MYKKLLAYIMAIAMVVCGLTFTSNTSFETSAAVADPSASGWTLQWSDEFNGSSLDTNVWGYDIGRGDNGWGNAESQYYTSRTSNVAVTDGNLKITAKKESYNGASYTSGRINSKNRKAFTFGKMEARIKVEGGNQNGVWPAFWMMGNDYDSVGWPACGELDIMEHANSNNYTEGTLHWGASWNSHASWGSYSNGQYNYYSDNTNNGINGWHTYGVTWDGDQIKWYMDDVVFLTANISSGMDSHSYFTKDAFFILNLALGSAGTGYTNYTAPDSNFSSATMYVDYVRAYSYNGETVTTTGEYPDGYTRASNDASWHDAGTAWSYYFNNSWANVDAAYKGGDSLNDFSVYMIKKSTENWGAQLKPKLSLDANSTYNYSFKIQMDSGGNSLHIKYEKSGTDQSLVNGTLSSGVNSYSGTFTTGSSTSGQIVFDLYGLTKGSTMTITEFAVWKNGETTTQAPTTTTAKPTTTVAPTTTTAPVTTTYSTLTPTDTVPTDSWGTFGIYKCYTGTWAGTNTAKAAVDPVNDSHIIVQKTDNNYNNAWLIQVKLELPELKDSYETGKYYYEWPIRLNGSDYSSKVLSSDGTNGDNNGTDIAPGYQTITGEIEIDKNNDNMPGIVIGMGWVNPNNTIDFYRPTVKLADHTIVYPPQETTTAAPTTTTAKPTTTAVPTTTAKPTTTVAPTTTQAPQEAAPSGYLAQLIGDNIQINYDDTRQAYLYVDGQKQSYTVNNGTQLATSTFTSGQHSFAIAVVTADSYGESEKTTATNINIPEPPTEAPTTTAVPTTTKDYPDGYTKMSYNSWVDLGAWKYKCGDWSAMKAAYKGGDVLNGFSVYIRNSSTAVNNGGAFVVPKFDLEANTKYSYNIIIDTDYSDSTQPLKIMRYVNDSSVGKVVQKSLDNGTNTWTGSFTTADTAGEEIRIDLSYIPKGYTITFTEFSVVKASDPTTQAPTTTVKPTTTVAPTTTVKPTTTVAPTTTVKPTTTVAPTTTAKPTTTAAPTTTVQPTSSDPYSDLTFTDITNNNNDQFDQKLLGSQKAITEGSTFSTLNVCQYQNTRYSELYIAGPWSAANLTATVNGVADSVTIEGAGLRIYDAANFLTQRYNVIDVTADGTHGQIIVFCPEIPGGETTTPDPSQPTTKPPVVNPWKVVNGSDNKFYYNNITKQGISDVVNVQKPDFAEQTGIYISLPEAISEVTVNGKTSGVAAIQGAGAVVYLSALDRYFNKVSFKRGENTSYIEIRNVEGTLLYDVEDFKSGEHYTYPEYDGKVFAGWYTDSSYETVYTPNSGQAYAKFIDEEVLSVKFQWANDHTALRFLTSVDDEAYLDAGFIISGTYGNSSFTNKERHAKVLYYSVLANGVKLYPNTEFHESSKFFATYTLSGMNPSTKSTWAVRAFYVTPDGTTVISDEYEHEYTP